MVRHTRYPAGKDWLPEAFKQEAASSTEYPHRKNTDAENIAMYIRMFVNKRISYYAMCEALREYYAQLPGEIREILMYTYTKGNADWFREKLRPFSGRVYR